MTTQRPACNLQVIILFLLCQGSGVLAAPNLLSNQWTLCSDNDVSINTGSEIRLNSECLFQEITARVNDQHELVCATTTTSFNSAQLAYSDQNFRVLRASVDTSTVNDTLRVSNGLAPENTQYAVVTLFASDSANMNCVLSSVGQASQQSNTTPIAGICIDDDNDGYGWNGLTTCIPPGDSNNSNANTEQNENSPASVTPGACVDDDNDGYGWDGVATCTVQLNGSGNTTSNTNTNTSNTTPDGISASSTATPGPCIDSDNDGYGWDGVATCRVVSNQSNNSQIPIDISSLTDLILITGQSNAQGAGTEVDLAVLDAPYQRVFAFTDNDSWQVADLRQHWDGPDEVRHPGNNALIFPGNTPHNNFALHFGKALIELDPQRVVGFVLATAPGAGIKYWDKGDRFYQVISNKAMAALNASSKTSFDAVLWHQGETDFLYNGTSDVTATPTERSAANYYPDRLYSLISNLRREAWFSSDKPLFICAETQNTNPNTALIAPVNQRLMALESDSDSYSGCVSADGLQTQDGIHFNAAAMRELGRRYAVKYLQMKRQ